MMKWYERLKIAREAQGLKKSHFASRIGVTPATITEWEGGLTTSPSASNTLKICEVLKVSPDWLINGEDAPDKSSNKSADVKRAIEIMESLSEPELKQLLAIINTFSPNHTSITK
ncbi:helix-turn-helix domain-containing protein [Undibacterium sp.]|uniref:helix-turn-helix domain-containing protein n=1 Tax=Undibacterium sp. TaxID=1914977 RepID=UPI0037503C85